jgi:hypothetical protein
MRSMHPKDTVCAFLKVYSLMKGSLSLMLKYGVLSVGNFTPTLVNTKGTLNNLKKHGR